MAGMLPVQTLITNNKSAEITKHKEITQHLLCIKVAVAGQCSSLLLC